MKRSARTLVPMSVRLFLYGHIRFVFVFVVVNLCGSVFKCLVWSSKFN